MMNDPLDVYERELEAEERQNFVPSKELISNWLSNRKGKSFAKWEQSLPEQCRKLVAGRGASHITDTACADPWYKTKNCAHSYMLPDYRLGDLYFGYAGKMQNRHYTRMMFTDSIGAKFVESTEKGTKQQQAMLNVVNSEDYKDFEKPAEDALVVHIRAYDVLTIHKDMAGYTKGADFYRKHAQRAANHNITKVVLVTGDHHMSQIAHMKKDDPVAQNELQASVAATKKRVSSIAAEFEKMNLSVTKRLNMNADCDFVFMANSKHFLASGGTFDQVIKKMIQKKHDDSEIW